MSRPCPTLAAACCVARSRGRRLSPSGLSPAAIAPDDTSTTCLPALTRSEIASTSASQRCTSPPPAGLASDDEPTLTTSRFALATTPLLTTPALLVDHE